MFVLPSGGGGGGSNSVAQEVMGLARLGVDARLAVNAPNYAKFVTAYPELEALKVPVLSYADAAELAPHMASCRVVVATTNRSVFDVNNARTELLKGSPQAPVKFAYYVQDYEPLFYPANGEAWLKAYQSYSVLKDAMLFAKTKWLCDIVYANHGIRVMKVAPSIDHDVYFPDLRRNSSQLMVAAMLRPSTPRRAPWRTARVMEAISRNHANVSMQVFGATTEELTSAGIELPPGVKNWGVLRRAEVPELLRGSDLFLDLSDYQAFGRTGLEGMACGCIPVVPILGGTAEYATHGRNAFVVDTRSDQQILSAINTFLKMDLTARTEMRQQALETAADFTITKAALSELRIFRHLAFSEG
ncbi:glycosyltransferase family 4 protein [Reyranella sp.]|uniref:glycosyltransferase family 4 protein n=1 Tax=Reyranella sp. TaxID=1929291 RepID=UPI003D0B8560